MAGSGNDGDDGAQSERRTDESFKRGEEFRQKVTASLGETVDLAGSDPLITSGIRLSDIPSSGESTNESMSSSRPSSKRASTTGGLHSSTELPPMSEVDMDDANAV